jgi:hypothetical protein
MSMLQDAVVDDSEVDIQALLTALTALRHGDFSVRLPASWVGLSGKVGDTFNAVMDQLEAMTDEIDRVSGPSLAPSAAPGPAMCTRSTR